MGYALFVKGAPVNTPTDDVQMYMPLLAMPDIRRAMGSFGMLDGDGIPARKLCGNEGHQIPARQIRRALRRYQEQGEPLPAFAQPPYTDGWDESAVVMWWDWIALLEHAAHYSGLEVW